VIARALKHSGDTILSVTQTSQDASQSAIAARIEWPTVFLLSTCYALWGLSLTWITDLWLPFGMLMCTLTIALHASLQHEIIHGHPFRAEWLNQLSVFPTLNLAIPFLRFKETHLRHHQDANLTDPYDDPESNYLAADRWARLPRWHQALLCANNTLLGRLLLGPALSQIAFMQDDLKSIRNGRTGVLVGWLWHLPSLGAVIALVWWSPMPVWAYAVSAYLGLSLLKIRTFLEHQAHDHTSGRTVVIEDRGLLAFLFLNNNLHIVHHMHPRVPWYALPKLYFSNRARYLNRNFGYRYGSYSEVFRKHFLRPKDPVPHPFLKR
jgi:fatty acid desaturase